MLYFYFECVTLLHCPCLQPEVFITSQVLFTVVISCLPVISLSSWCRSLVRHKPGSDVFTVNIDSGIWPPSRCAAGHVAEAFQGWSNRELGNLQQAVRRASELTLPWEGGPHASVPQLHLHHSEECVVARRELLHLLVQRVSWWVQQEADLPQRAR